MNTNSKLQFARWHIGNVRITKVEEMGDLTLPPQFALPTDEATVTSLPWLQPHFATPEGHLRMSIRAFVIESEGKRIVVDTCVGNDKDRAEEMWNHLNGPFLEHMAEAGFPVESVDYVLCTHLHVDHVGWNTRKVDGKWVPTFPKARYLFAEKEWAHWSKQEPEHWGDVMGDSVRPVIDAGLADLVGETHRITGEVWLEPTPGHTPGHVSVRISSGGSDAVITGDMMHHPIQIGIPQLSSNFCTDPDAARVTRRAFIERYTDKPVLVLGTHFATPTGGHISREGTGFRFDGKSG
jgi:glyoxylase-like metal-dependent hydrolase (beta-lactamase superfamily II)